MSDPEPFDADAETFGSATGGTHLKRGARKARRTRTTRKSRRTRTARQARRTRRSRS